MFLTSDIKEFVTSNIKDLGYESPSFPDIREQRDHFPEEIEEEDPIPVQKYSL